MRYLLLLLLVPVMPYTISYAMYNWNRKNRKAALGVLLLAAAAIVVPVIMVAAE